jgi:hypothetical protein
VSLDSVLSLQDRLRQSLKPLGGPLRIDGFFSLMVRERASRAAVEKAAQEAARKEVVPKEGDAPPAPEAGHLDDEVQAYMQREQVEDSRDSEVTDFMDFLGDSGFGPDTQDG